MEQTRRKKSSSLLVQGSILAIASLIVRLIGFFYRIPLVNLLGDEGMGYYSNSFVIYSFALTVSAYGMPAAISKIVSARMVQKKYSEANKVFFSAFILAIIIGIISASVLWFGAGGLAELIATSKSKYAIQALAPALFVFSLMAVFRGYYQGMNTMIPTAISQIVEQIFNAIFSLVMATLLLSKGSEYAASGGTMGTGIGAFAGLITLVVIYFMSKNTLKRRIDNDKHMVNESYFSLSKLILMTSIPMVIGTATFHITNLVDMFMFQNALLFQGYSEEATAIMYGVLTGKYKLLITLPISIASALATATIPSITASLIRNNQQEIKKKINLALRFVMFLAFPAVLGLFTLSKPIVVMLFNTENLDIAAKLLKVGTISIIFFSISTISIGILQGINKLRIPVINAAISLGIKVVLNFILLYVFNTNLYGAVITNVIFAFSSAYLNMRAIKKITNFTFEVKKTFIIPFISSIVMAIICFFIYNTIFTITISNTFATLVAIGIGVITYVMSLILLKGINEEELRSLPKGNKIANVLIKLKLLS